jgi:hypothetical protein
MDWIWNPQKLLDAVMGWMAGAILDSFDALFSAIVHGLLVSPDVTVLPQVQALTGRSVWVVDTVFVLAFIAAGVLTVAAGGDERSRYTAKDLMPRLVVGFIAAHFSPMVCAQAIGLANALTAGLAPGDTNRPGALDAIKTHVHAAHDHTVVILFAIIVALIAVLLAATLMGMLVRVAVLLVLTAAAPLALALHALPQTDPVARLWWRAFTGCLATPMLQAFCLQAGQWMLEDPAHLLPDLGLPVEPGAVINLFIVVVLLWTTVKIPGLVSRYISQGGRGPNVLGAVVRVVVVQQLGRAVPGLGRGVRAVTR